MAILKDTILVATATLCVGSAFMEIPSESKAFNKLFPYIGTFLSAGIGYYFLRHKGYIKAAEYQPSQEMDDYSLSEIAKSSAIEGFEPMKFSVVGNRAEGLETIFDAEGLFGDKPSINISWKSYIDANEENKDKIGLFKSLEMNRVLAMPAEDTLKDKRNIEFDIEYPMVDMNYTTMDLRGYFDFNGGRFYLIKYDFYELKMKTKQGQPNFLSKPSYMVLYSNSFDDFLQEKQYVMVSGASNTLSKTQIGKMVSPRFNDRDSFKNRYRKIIDTLNIHHLGFITSRKQATNEALQFLYFNCLTPELELDFDESLEVASNEFGIEGFQNMIIPYTYKVKDHHNKTVKITNYYYVDENGKCKFFVAININENGLLRFLGDTKDQNGKSKNIDYGQPSQMMSILEDRPILKYWLKSVVMDSANLSNRRINMWNTDREQWLKQQYMPMLSAKWLPVLFTNHDTALMALDYIRFMKSCLASCEKLAEDSPGTHLILADMPHDLDDNIALELFKKYYSSKKDWETLAISWNSKGNAELQKNHTQFYNNIETYLYHQLTRTDYNYETRKRNIYSILDTIDRKNTIVPISSWFGTSMPSVLPLEINNTKDSKVKAFRKIYNKYVPEIGFWGSKEIFSYYTNEESNNKEDSKGWDKYDPKEDMTIEPNPYEMLKNMMLDPHESYKPFDKEPYKGYGDEMEAESSKPHSVTISRSSNSEKKLMAVFEDSEGKKIKTTHFGQRGASDYTKHGDKERMQRYLERHGGGTTTSTKEDWKDPTTAGALSRWILWNKPSLSASFSDYKSRFGLKGTLNVSKSAEERKCKSCEKPATTVVQEGSFCYECLPINLGAEYEAKSPAQESLDDWNDEDWKTKSGKPSGETGERFLPTKAIESLTDKEYKETSDKKRKDSKKGKQFSEQPKSIAEKTAKYRTETFEAIEGTGSKARFTDTPDSKVYRDTSLRQKARNSILKGTKGGNAGQWSAIKANLSASKYRTLYENKYGEGKNPYF